MALSKRLRYEILRRDNHACRYCGACAPDAKLTVDHVVPTALGGSDEPANLVAACSECNSGKSATSPDAPVVADVAQDALRWKQAMEHAFFAAHELREQRNDCRDWFLDEWSKWQVGGREGHHAPIPLGWENSIDRFMAAGLKPLDMDDAIGITMRRAGIQSDERFRYFCGVMWRMLSTRQQKARELLDAEQVPE